MSDPFKIDLEWVLLKELVPVHKIAAEPILLPQHWCTLSMSLLAGLQNSKVKPAAWCLATAVMYRHYGLTSINQKLFIDMVAEL